MADAPTTTAAPGGMTVTVQEGKSGADSVTPGSAAPVVHTDTGSAVVLDMTKQTPPAATTEAPAAETPTAPTAEAPAEAPAEDLGDYDPAKPETVAKYDAAMFQDGKLNVSRLTAEWDASAKDPSGADGKLSENSYKYLQDKLGVPKEVVDQLAAGQVALRAQASATFLAPVGGKEKMDAMMAWGSGVGGYTQAQKDALNVAFKAGGQAAADQRDLLALRYAQANPAAPVLLEAAVPAAPRGRPPQSPARSATVNAAVADGPVGPPGYATYSEYSAAFAAAAKLQGAARDDALAVVRAKDKNSTYPKR